MAEVQFAKVFLATLDRRPVRLNSDFVSDPRKYPSQTPYTLPRPSHPFPSRSTASASSTITVNLKPTKPTQPSLSLPNLDPRQTTVLDLKTTYASHSSIPLDKVKILHAKRPAADLKTLAELLPSPTPAEAELGVMLLAGATASAGTASPPPSVPAATVAPPQQAAAAPLSESAGIVAGDAPMSGVIDEAFWGDLRDFLVQRLRDEGEGERLLGVFRRAAG